MTLFFIRRVDLGAHFNSNKVNLPIVQLAVEHFSTSEVEPGQSWPFRDGGGLLHWRVFILIPSPQVAVQGDQFDQGPH
jgi:hypothetical protein